MAERPPLSDEDTAPDEERGDEAETERQVEAEVQ